MTTRIGIIQRAARCIGGVSLPRQNSSLRSLYEIKEGGRMDTEEGNEVEVKEELDRKKSGSPIACCSVLDIIELNPPYDYRKRRKLLDDLIHE